MQAIQYAVKNDMSIKLTGEESYEIVGNLLTKDDLKSIIKLNKGRSKYANCLEKAQTVQDYLQKGNIVAGSCLVMSKLTKTTYGFYYRPPFEFHAWLEIKDKGIIDVSLPGIIEVGSTTKDEIGFLLEGRKPIVLAGKPLNWIMYQKYCNIKFY